MAKTILLVDNEGQSRQPLKRALQRSGCQVYDTPAVSEAAELYQGNKPECVFFDIKYPNTPALEALKEIKEVDPQAKVYFITGVIASDRQYGQKAKEMGAVDYISKPVIFEELLEFISKID